MKSKQMPSWWPAKGSVPHVYWTPAESDTALHKLIAQGQQVSERLPYLQPVPHPWLHMTLATIADIGIDRAELSSSVEQAVRDVAPFTVQFGSTLVTRSAVMLDTYDPTGQLDHLAERVMSAVRTLTSHVEPSGGPHHLTTAYGTAQGPADDPTGSTLRRACMPSHACAGIKEISIVDVDAHLAATTQTYTWSTLATIQLGK